ncbi:MAG: hypothetical protein L6R39_006995, partial [Caloplaca ligustica]
MITSYVCLRCHQQLVRRLQCLRNIAFVSLQQTIKQPVDNPPKERIIPPTHGQDGRKSSNAHSRRTAQAKRPIARIERYSSRTNPVLETLLSSQQEKRRKFTQTSDSGSLINRTDEFDKYQIESWSSRDSWRRSCYFPDVEDLIAALCRREQQIAEWINNIRTSMRDITAASSHVKNTLNAADEDNKPGDRDNDNKARFVTTIIKKIERAVQRYDVAWMAKIWEKYQWTVLQMDLDQRSQKAIYMHLLSAFVALSRQKQAVDVWNHMLQGNIRPNEKHWNAMLKGCFRTRDASSLQELWTNMIASGTEPDMVLWTSYIHGLILCGRWQRGLQVLDELGAKWKAARRSEAKAASQGQPSTSTDFDPNTPSLAPIQAALTALTAIQRHELCLPVLDWAKSHSLTLTTEIFNILLRPTVRSGDAEQTARIFSLMSANNCSPDAVTYIILLNGHMSNANSSDARPSPQEERDSILRILDDMTAHKMSIDRRTYSTILEGLLSPKTGSRNDNAARAVLEHMARKNLTPDSYIYHMLVTHYFSLSPPNLPAIEAIWARVKTERPSLQPIFYEKMVEGYAKVGA